MPAAEDGGQAGGATVAAVDDPADGDLDDPADEEFDDELPTRSRPMRLQLNTKMRIDLLEDLRRFATRRDAAIQDVIEAAVEQYLTRRGARKGARRRSR